MTKWLEIFRHCREASSSDKIAKNVKISSSDLGRVSFDNYDSFDKPNKFLTVLGDDTRFYFEERAAIIEYDGNINRQEAEALAWKELNE